MQLVILQMGLPLHDVGLWQLAGLVLGAGHLGAVGELELLAQPEPVLAGARSCSRTKGQMISYQIYKDP